MMPFANADNTRLRRLYRLGFFFYLAYLVLALVYYRERSSFVDIPYHLFEMTRTGGPAIQNYRFVALLTQWAPVLAVKAGLPLNAIMVIYSLAFALLYGVVYWLCGVMRQYGIGLAWLLCQSLFVTHTFFWMQSELPQGLAVLFLSLAVLLWHPPATGGSVVRILLLLLLLPTLAFSHPLLAAPFLAVLAMLWFFYKDKSSRVWIAATAILYIGAYLTRAIFFSTTYDNNATDSLRYAGQSLLHIWSLPVTTFVLRKWVGAYALMPLALAFLLWLYARRRVGIWQWLVLLGGFGGYLLIIILGNIDTATAPFYRENLLLPLGVLLAVPLVLYGLPFLQEKKWAVPVLCIILLGTLARTVVVGFQYQKRYRWLVSFVAAHPAEKLILAEKPEHRQALILTWSIPYEAWLVSTAMSGTSASLLLEEHPESLEWATHDSKMFLSRWGAFQYRDLPTRYFHFPDTTGNYRIVH